MVGMQNGLVTGKQFGIFLIKLSIPLYDPAFPFLDINLKEMKTEVHTKTYMLILMLILFVIAKNCDLLQCVHHKE